MKEQWTSVEEDLPVKRGDYLCVLTDNYGLQFQRVLSHVGATPDGYSPTSWWGVSSTIEYTNVTHWRPLPPMPGEVVADQPRATEAIPVLRLDQADVGEPIIEFAPDMGEPIIEFAPDMGREVEEMTLEHTEILYHILAPLQGVEPAQLRRVAAGLVGRGGEFKACGLCLERAAEHLWPGVPKSQKRRGFEESYGSATFPLGSAR